MRKRMGRYGLALLLMGMFSMTQMRVIGKIGVSELFAFIAAPLFFIQDYNELRRHGFLPIVWLSIFVMLNCIGSIIYNDVIFENGIRGFATTYAMFALLIVMHRFLSRDIWSIRWFVLGLAISAIINIFFLKTGGSMYHSESGTATVEEIVSGPLFWLEKLGPWLALPTMGWYLKTPLVYSLFALPIMGVINMLTTESGRSALLAMLFSATMIAFGRKKQSSMRAFKKHFIVVMIALGLCGLALKSGYKFLAEHGYLNEKAQVKYKMQTAHGSSVLKMLMAGRMEFFCGIFANLKSPIWGYGPWAMDRNGVYESYLFEYGEAEEIAQYFKAQKEYGGYFHRIPAHSMIIGGWTWYGIMAFFFWAYVLYLMYDVLKNYLWIVPAFFGYFAITLPNVGWAILFSPFGNRVERITMIVMLLLVRGIANGRVKIGMDPMSANARKQWRRYI